MEHDSNWKQDWNAVKDSRDIFELDCFLTENAALPEVIREEASAVFSELKESELDRLRKNPAAGSLRFVEALLARGIVTLDELVERQIISHEAYVAGRRRHILHERLPHVCPHSEWGVDSIPKGKDVTDIYIFGAPASGKTCMLMGLMGSASFTWKPSVASNEYEEYLTICMDCHTAPYRNERTAFIHGKTDGGKDKDYLLNIFDVSGQELMDKIVEDSCNGIALSDMDAPAAKLLSNNNRKIFLIAIDATDEEIAYCKKIKETDEDGDDRIQEVLCRVSQRSILRKLINIFWDPKNQDIMKKVDAIHFVATKSDVTDCRGNASDEPIADFNHIYGAVNELCRNYRINNASAHHEPQVYTFSLGRWYVGGYFDYVSTDSDKLLEAIAENIEASRKPLIKRLMDRIF